MNQNDQMREALESAIEVAEHYAKQLNSNDLWTHAAALKEALNHYPDTGKKVHVNETPKNEHMEPDVLKKSEKVDVMREALRRYDEFECKNCDQQLNKAERTIEIFRQALAAQAAPTERAEGAPILCISCRQPTHHLGNVCFGCGKKGVTGRVDLSALLDGAHRHRKPTEPVPLVRLTHEELAACVVLSDSYCEKENRWCVNSNKYANAIMDAMIKKNGGQQ